MVAIVNGSYPLREALENFASVVDGKYYFLPIWFEKTENGNFKMHHLEKLPIELRDKVKELRNTNKK